MASFCYQRGIASALAAENLATATVKALLIESTYTPDKDHDFVADLTPASNELSGTGYSRKTLASQSMVVNDADDRAVFDALDITWVGIDAGTAAAVVLYVEKTNDADSILLAYIDNGGFPVLTNGGDLEIEWSALGILYVQC